MAHRAVVLIALVIATNGLAQAQEAAPSAQNQILENIESSFSLPVRDWLRPRGDSKKEHPLRGFSIAPSNNIPLFTTVVPGSQGVGNQGTQTAATSTATVSVKYNPISYWFVQTTFYAYISPSKQQPWNPDFSYSFGYDDWHPYTFSLTYANYGGNRFHPNPALQQQFTVFTNGTFSLGWKFQLPKRVEDQLKLTEAGALGWSVAYNLTPQYTDPKTLTTKGPKQTATVSFRDQLYKSFYGNITAYVYLIPGQQQAWDPDFSYGFGYFDYRPGKFSVQYNNYSGNRFPWKRRSPGTGDFRNGVISISWNWSWAQ